LKPQKTACDIQGAEQRRNMQRVTINQKNIGAFCFIKLTDAGSGTKGLSGGFAVFIDTFRYTDSHWDAYDGDKNNSFLGESDGLELGVPGEDFWTVLELPG